MVPAPGIDILPYLATIIYFRTDVGDILIVLAPSSDERESIGP